MVGPLPEHRNKVTVATATTKERKREQNEKNLVMTSRFDLFKKKKNYSVFLLYVHLPLTAHPVSLAGLEPRLHTTLPRSFLYFKQSHMHVRMAEAVHIICINPGISYKKK